MVSDHCPVFFDYILHRVLLVFGRVFPWDMVK